MTEPAMVPGLGFGALFLLPLEVREEARPVFWERGGRTPEEGEAVLVEVEAVRGTLKWFTCPNMKVLEIWAKGGADGLPQIHMWVSPPPGLESVRRMGDGQVLGLWLGLLSS